VEWPVAPFHFHLINEGVPILDKYRGAATRSSKKGPLITYLVLAGRVPSSEVLSYCVRCVCVWTFTCGSASLKNK
jgi:hypothetical protein